MLTPTLAPVDHRIDRTMTVRYTPQGCSACGGGPIRTLSIGLITHGAHGDPSTSLAVLDGVAAQSMWQMVSAWAAPAMRADELQRAIEHVTRETR